MYFLVSAMLLQLAFECGQQRLFDVSEYDDDLTDAQATALYGV